MVSKDNTVSQVLQNWRFFSSSDFVKFFIINRVISVTGLCAGFTKTKIKKLKKKYIYILLLRNHLAGPVNLAFNVNTSPSKLPGS